MEMTKEVAELAKARARRVRGLREALRYSRQKFCKKYVKHEVSYSALQSWEAIRWNGLTETGARKLAACFQDEGLNVTVEWLLFGTGYDPFEAAFKKGIGNLLPGISYQPERSQLFSHAYVQEPAVSYEEKSSAAHENILQELKLFHQLNPGSIDARVTDEGLTPYLQSGDYVAGQRYFESEMEKGIGRFCIVQLLSGAVLTRLVKSGDKAHYYTLACTHSETTMADATVKNVKLFSVAPILWIRKPG